MNGALILLFGELFHKNLHSVSSEAKNLIKGELCHWERFWGVGAKSPKISLSSPSAPEFSKVSMHCQYFYSLVFIALSQLKSVICENFLPFVILLFAHAQPLCHICLRSYILFPLVSLTYLFDSLQPISAYVSMYTNVNRKSMQTLGRCHKV